MVSKGVESVPSPVRNLREWDPFLDHQSFFDAVAEQFIHVYGGSKNVNNVDESKLKDNEFVRKSFEELQNWEWQWGQTPEFTIQIDADFTWGSSVRRHCQTLQLYNLNILTLDCFFFLSSDIQHNFTPRRSDRVFFLLKHNALG